MIAAYQRISRADGDLGKDGKEQQHQKPERTDPAVYFPQRESAKSACDGFCG